MPSGVSSMEIKLRSRRSNFSLIFFGSVIAPLGPSSNVAVIFPNYRNSGNTQFFFLDKRGSARAQQLGAEIVLSERGKAEGSLNPAQQISRGDAEARRGEIFIVEKGEPYRDRDGWG